MRSPSSPAVARREVADVLALIGPHLLAASGYLHSGRHQRARVEFRSIALIVRRYLPAFPTGATRSALERRAQEEAIALHDLAPAARAKLRAQIPAAVVRALRSIRLAADLRNEPVGALGHLAFARAEIDAVLGRASAMRSHRGGKRRA